MKSLARLVRTIPPVARVSSPAETPTTGCPFGHSRKVSVASPAHESATALPFECIPTAKGLPIIGTVIDLIQSGGAGKIHEYFDKRHKQLGPIFREILGGHIDVVVISEKDYMRRVYTSEGRFPKHMVPEPWLIYNQKRNITRGLFFMEGKTWFSRRTILNQILTPKESYSDSFNPIVRDLVDRWGTLSERSEDGVVPDLEKELYNWSIETLGSMVFGRRLGCVRPAEYESEMHEFVHHVQQIFTESAKMAVIPPKLASTLRLPVWRRFEKAADTALELARGYVEDGIKQIEIQKQSGVQVKGILKDLLAVKEFEVKEIIQIVADLILAAADTTSHATQWTLHCLAKHPECQEKLWSEIQAAVPPGEDITEEHLKQIPYLPLVINETLRLYPIASFLTRILPRKIVLGNYEVPAGKLFFMSQYTAGRDPEIFPEPEKFLPERWRRTAEGRINTAHACLPFGQGQRACIGRKMAEFKMQLMLAKTVQAFHMESANEKEVGIDLRMITTPDQPIKLRLKKRNT